MTVAETDMIALLTHLAEGDTGFLTDLGPLVLAATALGVARDSRSFARLFETAHALVIRECTHLSEDLTLLTLDNRGDKSGRIFFELTASGRALCEHEDQPQ